MKRLLFAAIVGAVACGGTEVKEQHGNAVEHGAFLFSNHDASPSSENRFACSTCHSARGTDPRVLTGAALGGATKRPRYWGGTVLDLLVAINACRIQFMDAHDPWTENDEDAKAMYAYLVSLPDVAADAVPFTVVRTVADVPAGDASRGKDVYERACQTCHGAAHSAEGRLEEKIPLLPEDTKKAHAPEFGYTPQDVRIVVIEKIRHGGFLGYGGAMPPYSREALDDGKVADVLAYLGF